MWPPITGDIYIQRLLDAKIKVMDVAQDNYVKGTKIALGLTWAGLRIYFSYKGVTLLTQAVQPYINF